MQRCLRDVLEERVVAIVDALAVLAVVFGRELRVRSEEGLRQAWKRNIRKMCERGEMERQRTCHCIDTPFEVCPPVINARQLLSPMKSTTSPPSRGAGCQGISNSLSPRAPVRVRSAAAGPFVHASRAARGRARILKPTAS